MIREIGVVARQHLLICDECEELMIFEGQVFTSNPPQFPHSCKNGHRKIVKYQYPRIEYYYDDGSLARELMWWEK